MLVAGEETGAEEEREGGLAPAAAWGAGGEGGDRAGGVGGGEPGGAGGGGAGHALG